MDIATLVGFALGIGLIAVALLLGGNVSGFWDTASMLMVGGGTIAASLVNFPLKQFLSVMKVLPKVLFAKEEDLLAIIKQFIQLAVLVRKDGQLVLENEAKNMSHPLMQRGLMLVADGVEAEAISGVLNLQLLAVQQRHKVGQELFKAMGRWAPAFGMIGTLVGLVQMLGNLSDPKSIGPSMAVAILTTFYGAVIANVFCLPMAAKLKQRSEQEVLVTLVISEGLKGLQIGLNPRMMEEKLKGFLATSQQKMEIGAA